LEGVDIEACGEGGYNIGWTSPGEWLSYTVNVDSTMDYNIDIRAAVNSASKINVTFSNGNVSTGDINLPATGGWQSWNTLTVNRIPLNKGIQEMKITVVTEGFNLNYVQVKRSVPVGINEFDSQADFSVYPNPLENSGMGITVLSNCGPAEVSVYSIHGKNIFTGQIQDGVPITIDRTFLSNGVYLIKFTGRETIETRKLIVQ
jgi:hypothetical protein